MSEHFRFWNGAMNVLILYNYMFFCEYKNTINIVVNKLLGFSTLRMFLDIKCNLVYISERSKLKYFHKRENKQTIKENQ